MTGDAGVSRRAVLRATGGALGATAAVGRGAATDGPDCSDATVDPKMVHCADANAEGCAADHPATREVRGAVERALEETFPTVGSLLEAGFVPYFDLFESEGASYSHWLNPTFIGDDTVLDPSRPASILVDDKYWRPIGMMFIATREDERVTAPAVYDDERGRCAPWHSHVGLPGRYAWWKHRTVYAGADPTRDLPCSTPCMMHVWAYPHPEGPYAHGPPPRGNRGGPPAEPAGFETDVDPTETKLGPAVLPDGLLAAALGGGLRAPMW